MPFQQMLPHFMSLIRIAQHVIAHPFAIRRHKDLPLHFLSTRRARRFGLMANFGLQEHCTRRYRAIGSMLGTTGGSTTNARIATTL